MSACVHTILMAISVALNNQAVCLPIIYWFPNLFSSTENAIADVERAEKQYIDKVKEYREENKATLAEVVAKPSKYLMRFHELEQ